MSRVGKNPIVIPAGVEVSVGEQITVKGPLGTLKAVAHPSVKVVVEGQNISVSKVDGAVNGGAMWGTMRANLNNMVTGVSTGFQKKLQLVGVGYRAQAAGDTLNLSIDGQLTQSASFEVPSASPTQVVPGYQKT